MSAPGSPAQRTRRARKSIAHVPSSSIGLDGENTVSSSMGAKSGKKSRSKSLGPGGLGALQESSGNSRKAMPSIRSILKPVIPLSPPKQIPPRTTKTADKEQTRTAESPATQTRSSTSTAPASPNAQTAAATSQSSEQPQVSAEVVALRTEEEQQADARARERAEAIRRRDERRKSLANRRVSFAPEATLHTWDVVEINEDATTSSEATNSTRRHSSGNTLGSDFTHGTQHASGSNPALAAGPEDQMSSPGQLPEVLPRRRNSGIPSADLNEVNEGSSSPGSMMADDDTQSSFVTNPEEEVDDISDTDTYRDDETTAMDIDEDDATANSVGSMRTDETSSSSSSALDARLRQAVQLAGTQRLDHIDETDRMISRDDERRQRRNESLIEADFEADHDTTDQTGAMEMTKAVGGIITQSPARSPSRRNSKASRRRSSGTSSVQDEQTMDFTAAVGGIRRVSASNRRDSSATVATEDEDMSMELTGVVGGFVNQAMNDYQDENLPAEQTFSGDMTGQMEVTTALGRILSPVTERTEPSTEASMSMDLTTAVGAIRRKTTPEEDATATMAMDVTQAIGHILPAELTNQDRTTARKLMEEEAEHGQLIRSPLVKQSQPPELTAATKQVSPVSASSRGPVTTPTTGGRQTTPLKARNTPTHQITPQPAPRPTTPSKTPPNRNIAMRRTSPRKLFSQSTRERASNRGSPMVGLRTNDRRATIDPANMNITLTPQFRRLSGQGADQAGLGSPRVTAMLDRRTSIGDAAETFTPQGPARGVRFTDPREMEQEIDKQRDEELSRESGREALERESDPSGERDTTLSLRDMIQSLTPKKKKDLKGRKSLAVGSARGLLGKRPAELDDEEEEEHSPKRVQGPDRSPVKSIRLPAPPSKAETTGRLGKIPRLSLGITSGNASTPTTESVPKATTPRHQQRFRDSTAVDNAVEPPVSFNDRINGAPPSITADEDDEAIQLQDFLNLINVRFMDLETTKRRHTIVPRDRSSTDTASDERSLEDCIAAGVSTIPMLELYQHSCRELKKYISEGRNIVREIEADTFEDNPLLFKEYMSAAPDVRAIMDNQFKNVKTHARLLSREMWYEWRMKLLEGLKDGLIKIAEGLIQDSEALDRQEQLLNKVVPSLVSKFDDLFQQEENLRKQAEEFEMNDKDELRNAREQLARVDAEFEEKQRLLAELKAEKASQDEQLGRLTARRQQCLTEIAESQKLCDEFRGWKMSEVATLKAEIDAMSKSSGWSVVSASSECLDLSYRDAVSLTLTPASFQPASASPSAIRLSLRKDGEPSTQERFFLQLLRARLHALDQPSTPVSDVLRLVSNGWTLASRLKNTVSDLTISYITDVAITGDESLAVSAIILVRQMRTKVKVKLDLRITGASTNFGTSTRTDVQVIYGEELKEGRMGEFLSHKISSSDADDLGGWIEAVHELETRLIARGKK